MFTYRVRMYLAGIASISLLACGSSRSSNDQTQAKPPEQGTSATETETVAPGDPIDAALAHQGRPAEDRARDANRKPGEVLRFFGIGPGMKVAELMTGTGYYAELLGRVVGPQGHVYAQNNDFIVNRFPMDKLKARLAQPELSHVEHVVKELDALDLPKGELDAILMVLFYHDTYWMGVDRAKMNAQILEALKPGGIYGIVDHYAEDGSGERDVKTLHRGDAAMIKQEILNAGFELVGESEALRRPQDDRKRSVFDKEMRDKTDQFIYKFRKPL